MKIQKNISWVLFLFTLVAMAAPISAEDPTTYADLEFQDPNNNLISDAKAFCTGSTDSGYTATYWEIYVDGVLDQQGYSNNNGNNYYTYDWINVIDLPSDYFEEGAEVTLLCMAYDPVNALNASTWTSSKLSARDPQMFYISNSGNDSNEGDYDNPFLTLEKAFSEIQDLDELVFKDDDYILSKNFEEETITIYKAINLSTESEHSSQLKIDATTPYSVIYWTDTKGGSLKNFIVNCSSTEVSEYGLKLAAETSNLNIEDVYFDSCNRFSAYISRARNINFDRVKIMMPQDVGIGIYGIYLIYTDGVKIKNSNFGELTNRINGTSGTTVIRGVSLNNNTVVENNTFYFDRGSAAIFFPVSYSYYSKNILIKNNFLDMASNTVSYSLAVGREGIDGSMAYNVTIRDNVIIGVQDSTGPNHGIFLGYTNYSRVINNTVSNTTYNFAIKGNEGCLIESNTVLESATNQGMVDKADHNCVFRNNKFYGRAGIRTTDEIPSNKSVVNSIWYDNQIFGTGVTTYRSTGDSRFVNHTSPNGIVVTNGSLTLSWYYRAFVTNMFGRPLNNVDVSIYDSSWKPYGNAEALFDRLTTEEDGYTPVTVIDEYVNLAGVKTYLSNYTIFARISPLSTASHEYNVTENQNNLQDVFILSNPTTASKPINHSSLQSS